MTTLEEYQKLLKNHDWTYMYSDDHRCYMNGAHNENKLERLSRTSELHKQLYKLWRAWYSQSMKQDKWLKTPEIDDVEV